MQIIPKSLFGQRWIKFALPLALLLAAVPTLLAQTTE